MTGVENVRATLAELANEDVAEVIAEARAGEFYSAGISGGKRVSPSCGLSFDS